MYHEMMLSDRMRNAAFHKALKKHIRKDSTVLDIGTGTGVWAILAAQLGAARVVAIEREKLLIPVIKKLLLHNRVQDRVEVIHGDSRTAKLRGKFDLVISETIGNEAFDEEIVPIMIDARRRFLKKGGTLIPHTISSMLAPAYREVACTRLPAGLKLRYDYLASLSLDIPKRVSDRSRLKFIGKPRALVTVDLRTAKSPPMLKDLSASWRLRDASQINCLVLWAEVVLADRIKLRTIDSTNWTPIAFPIEPFAPGPALINCRFTMTDRQYYWTLILQARGRREIQSHSPVFPYTSLKTRLDQ